MQLRIPAALSAALAAGSLGLAGCSTGTVSTVTHTPALQTNGGRATARSSVQTAIIASESSNGLVVPGLTPASAIRIMRGVVHRRSISATGAATGACNSGVKQSRTSSAGSTTTTTDLFYEPTCVTLENEQVVTVSPAAGGITNGTGSLTTFDRSGNLTSSHALTLSESTDPDTGADTITLIDNASATAGGPVVDKLGVTCVGQPNAVNMTCTSAHVGTTAATTTGEAISGSTVAGTGGSPNTTTVAVTFFLGSLGIAESGTTWQITNATPFNSASGPFQFTSAGNTGSGSLTLADGLYAYSVTGTLGSAGLSVTIIENPIPAEGVTAVTPIATATVDAGGNGTMNFADGAVEPIWGGFVGI